MVFGHRPLRLLHSGLDYATLIVHWQLAHVQGILGNSDLKFPCPLWSIGAVTYDASSDEGVRAIRSQNSNTFKIKFVDANEL